MRRQKELWKVIVSDILVGALALGLVVFFQLGLPILQAKGRSAAREGAATPVPAETLAPVQTEAPIPTPETQVPAQETPAPALAEPTPAETVSTPEPTPEPTPDNRTEWQIRFAEHFTDEVVIRKTPTPAPRSPSTSRRRSLARER